MTRPLKTLEEILNPRRPLRCRRRRRLSPHRRKMGGMWNLKPFVTRSNKERAGAVIKLRNKLRMHKHLFGGRFIGDPDIVNPDRPVLYQQEALVYFPGTDKRVLWNAYIITARKAFWDEVGSMAFDRVWAMLPKEEKEQDIFSDFEPVSFNAWGQATEYRLREEDESYEELEGMTREEYKARLEKEIVTNEPPEIYESFAIDKSYEYGIGLKVVVDAEQIDRETVEMIIDRFLAVGETDWRSETAVPREKLPFETEMEAMMTIPPDKR